MKISFIQNKSFEVKKINTNISVGSSSIIIDSSFEKSANIDKNSCINRCFIGKYFGLGNFSYIADTDIGKFCTFASRVSISSFNHPTNLLSIHEFQYKNLKDSFGETILAKDSEIQNKLRENRTQIGSDVWIGDNAVILKGVEVDHGAIVGAGAVVTKNVEAFSIVVGNPARTIKKRFEDKIIEKLLALKWWNLSISDMKTCDFKDIKKAIDFIEKIKEKKSSKQK